MVTPAPPPYTGPLITLLSGISPGGNGGIVGGRSPQSNQPPAVNKNSGLCQASRALEQWSAQDAQLAFGNSLGALTAKGLPGQLALRAAKGLSGVTEVFSTSSFVEGLGAALINGYESGNYGGAAAQVVSQVLSKASGLEGAANETASQVNDRLINAAKFPNPCGGE